MSNEPLRSEFADDPEMQELLQSFSVSAAEACMKLRDALANGDLDLIRRIGHQFKGAGAGYGYPEVTEFGAELEDAVDREQTLNDTVRRCAAALIATCDRVQQGFQ